MTKKDYELIARVFKDRKDRIAKHVDGDFKQGADWGHEHLAVELADQLSTTNPRFNATRFLEACGIKA